MAPTSSFSSFDLESKYDVFLSFRGEDTRHTFTSHLYSALCRKQIAAFIDDDGLKRGDEISPALLKAIEGSKISVIILSKDYASSRWCLEELEKILECRKINGQMVVPVFYHVNPSDIRKQTGSFEEAFRKHEERFKEVPERVQRWRAALTEVADLSGWDSMVIRSESKLVEGIVGDIWKKLIDISPLNHNGDGLVGIDSRIEQIKSLLLKSKVIGIWGMGGIGKTTVAKTLFCQISRYFDGYCFIENVTEELKNCGGQIVRLQQKIISRILGEENHVIDVSNIIHQFIKDRLQRKMVLIVLDDVNDGRQLNHLMGGLEPLGAGSKIIITTRHKQVLLSFGMNEIYEVQELNDDEALLLFCKHAFKQNHPFEHFQELSNKTLAYAKGNPLALEVLGSSLCGKNKEEWESIVHDLKMVGETQIHDVLKISYDGLNKIEKSIFLDIACFLKREDKDLAIKILEACYKSTQYFLSVLIDKSLIKFSNNELQMHDLLQEMGKRIVCQESEEKPSKRSRLWDHEDIYQVLQNNEGGDVVESILLDMSRSREIHLSPRAFMNMTKLRLLKLYWPGTLDRYFGDHANISKVCLPRGLEYLPNELRYLRWDGYPLKALPIKFNPEKLVALEFPYSKIEEILKGTKYAFDFKSIICFSKHLIDFLRLKDINPEGRKRLLKVPAPIQNFANLKYLNMRECYGLRSFPTNIHFTSPISLDLSSCVNLNEFPQISGNIKGLCLRRTAIEEVPASIASLTELVDLDLSLCHRLKRISTSICKLRSLSSLFVANCLKLDSFPEIMEEMKNLQRLKLRGTKIEELPSSLKNLVGLNCLGRKVVTSLDLGYCKLKKFPEVICCLSSLRKLLLGGNDFENIPASIKKFSKLRELDLNFCNLKKFPEVICCLSSLRKLLLGGNDFENIPTSIKKFSKLRELDLNFCNMLQTIPELPLEVMSFGARDCEKLQALPEPPTNIEELPEPPTNIEELDQECESKQIIHANFCFENCRNLKQNILQERIQHMAEALRFYHEKVNKAIPSFSIVLPGSKIPEWFKHQSFGSLISIELPQNWCNKGLIGFALSATILSNDYFGLLDVECSFAFGDGNESPYLFTISGVIESEHIVLGFVDVRLLKGHNTTVTFKLRDLYNKLGPVIESCGVCPLYEEPNMTQSKENLTNEDLRESMLVGCSKRKFNDGYGGGDGVGGSDGEEVEPNPKRNCRN